MNNAIQIAEAAAANAAPLIRKAIEADGFAVLEPWDSEVDTLRWIGSLFGSIQSHIRADEQGVVGVGGPQSPNAEWQQYRSEYHGLGTGSVAPHSDGTFVDGIVADGAGVRRVAPPRYVILQVVRHADTGGANIVVDGQRVLDSLLLHEPELAATLCRPGCITFCRDDQIALDQAVFAMAQPGHMKIRFRGDSKAYSPDWARGAVETVRRWFESDDFATRVVAGEGQVLVLDNTRVLHGREAFANEDDGRDSGRKLRRIWIRDDLASPHLGNLAADQPTSRALHTYDPYAAVANDVGEAEPLAIQTGIRLDPIAMDIVSRPMFDAAPANPRVAV